MNIDDSPRGAKTGSSAGDVRDNAHLDLRVLLDHPAEHGAAEEPPSIDRLVRRDLRSLAAIEQAVEYGTRPNGDRFFFNVKPHEDEPPPPKRTPVED